MDTNSFSPQDGILGSRYTCLGNCIQGVMAVVRHDDAGQVLPADVHEAMGMYGDGWKSVRSMVGMFCRSRFQTHILQHVHHPMTVLYKLFISLSTIVLFALVL